MRLQRRIVAIKLDHIGDFALALPGLYDAYLSGAQIDVVVSKWNYEWKQIVPWIHKWWISDISSYDRSRKSLFNKVHGLLSYPKLALALSAQNYDAAIDLRMVQGDWRGKLLARLCCSPFRIGGPGSGENFLSSVHVPDAIHVEDQIKERLRLFVPLTNSADCKIELGPLSKSSSTRCKVILHPGCGAPARQWPQRHWIQLINNLSEMNLDRIDFYLMGGPVDIDLITNILNKVSTKLFKPLFPSTLKKALEEISTSSLLLCMNSSAQHLARLVGTPTITIFSGTDTPEQWAAKGNNTVLTSKPPCSPCHLHACNQVAHFCMEDILPEQVAKSIQEKLRNLSGISINPS